MLTQEDMQALAGLINTAVTASEERMKSYMEDSINTAIAASEERMKGYMEDSINTAIAASEERMKSYVDHSINTAVTASEERMKNHMNVVVESQVMPMIRQVADGVVQANERLDRLEKKVDDLEATVAAHEVWIVHKAQND
ncbi:MULTISPECIES: hypothetical protein [Eubacteriales]|uniref:hypothetical protein n=1 Tax=Eubacteriales TaxID=186802 RepID=UPI000B372656|nr:MULTISPECIES: hypothetical protein [Eubacteriales]MDY4166312.1 hypothetical protein [Fournierella sp.]OUP25455.1 hypothetical protein B5F28_01860 [Gemmiger sp. An194]